jgi:naphthalene 1,2-dioxygenase system ferredoxin subunit
VYAINNDCSHGNAKLCEGLMDGHLVECPFHQALFDVRDGAVTCGPASEPVKSWPVKIENGRVWVDLNA